MNKVKLVPIEREGSGAPSNPSTASVRQKVRGYIDQNDVRGLVKDFMLDLLREEPEDPLQYMQDWAVARKGPSQEEMEAPGMEITGELDPREASIRRRAWQLPQPVPPYISPPGDHHAENGHVPIEQAIQQSAATWQTLNAATPGSPTSALTIGFVADQDEASIETDGHAWDSYYSQASLQYVGAKGDGSYTLSALEEHKIVVRHAGDKAKGEGGRGAEFSALEMWQGELLTVDDRTGGVFSIATDGESFFVGKKIGNDGEHMIMLRGDGKKKGKGLKCEWTTTKDGKLYVGSTGKERTNDDGSIAHMGEMWVKTIDADWNVEHVDWSDNYNKLRKAAKCPPGAGYMIHESGRWSDIHQRWFFFPRKLSRKLYDEVIDERKCCNLMISCDAEFSEESICVTPMLTFKQLRGCSDFFFVPETNDTHIFAIRTEETIGGDLLTFASVFDLEGNMLMKERDVAGNRKFEGVCPAPNPPPW
jgi:soluble calcium-activated nucleotidase 1